MSLIIFPSDIAAEQKRTQAQADTDNQAITSCTNLDATTLGEWQSFYTALSAFCATTPVLVPFPWQSNVMATTASAGDTMMAYEKQLSAWEKRMSGFNCTAPAPNFTVYEPSSPLPSAQAVSQVFKYTAIAACAIGGAWIVSEIVSAVRAEQELRRVAPAPKLRKLPEGGRPREERPR